MRSWIGVKLAAAIAVATIVPAPAHADTVELTLHDGRVSLHATNASVTQIFDVWGRAGGVFIVNAERLATTPVTLTLNNVTEEQALDVLLRSVGGYLARRRTAHAPQQSVFDRIVILPTPAGTRDQLTSTDRDDGARGSGTSASASAGAAATSADEPQGIPVGPGVVRLVGADGQPVEDDQQGAPPPPVAYPDAAPPASPLIPPPQPPQPATTPAPPATGSTPTTLGSPTPGMPVPDSGSTNTPNPR